MSRMARDSASKTSPRACVPAAAWRMRNLRGRRGMTFIEVLIAVALLGVIVVTMMAGLSSIALATGHHRQQTTLDLLVRSDAEYIKSQGYLTKASGLVYQNITAAGYTFSTPPVVTYWDPASGTWTAPTDNGLQQISVTVTAPGGGTEQVILLKVQP